MYLYFSNLIWGKFVMYYNVGIKLSFFGVYLIIIRGYGNFIIWSFFIVV